MALTAPSSLTHPVGTEGDAWMNTSSVWGRHSEHPGWYVGKSWSALAIPATGATRMVHRDPHWLRVEEPREVA